MKNKYDIVYSIGHDCACSMYLKKHRLRVVSGPLDWLTSVPAHMRFDMIMNDFDGFMDADDFVFVDKDPNIFNDDKCDYYKNIRTGLYFYHDFAAGVPLKKSFPAVAEKYKRRIDRFYKNLRDKQNVLLVWFSHYHNTTNEQWAKFADDFSRKIGKKIDFLIIQHMENQYTPTKTIITPNIVRYDMHTIAKDEHGNNTTVGNEKLCDAIFSQYGLRVPRERRIKYAWKNCLLYGPCKFLPFHDARHAWRKKLKQDLDELVYKR
ncbi:MAG: hypothetical protein IIV74_03910 [Alphaproteobacteria bacterium]|nr:hypothetical protein [Alphaproteobacteria bacterium]